MPDAQAALLLNLEGVLTLVIAGLVFRENEHDLHHQYDYPPGTPTGVPHSLSHRHAPQRHAHAHYPDLHHRHPH